MIANAIIPAPLAIAAPMEDPAAASIPNASLARLTRRMAAGEEAAFAEFHAAYFPRLFRYALTLMRGDEAAARDVTQETLLRVVRHARAFDAEAPFWDWLARLARCAAADQGRRASRYRRLLETLRLRPAEERAAPRADDLEEAIARGLDQLPPADCDLLTRKYHEDASVRELARHLNLSEEAVESRLARARRHLREAAFRLLRHHDDDK